MDYLKSTPVKDANIVRVNQKLDLNENKILRELGTFSMPKQCKVECNKAQEPSTSETSQASRITDSAPNIDSNINNDVPNTKLRPIKEGV